MSDLTTQPEAPALPPSTAPESFSVCCRAFDTEERGRIVGNAVGQCVRLLGSAFDLSRLDGVTVAYDYAQALRDLERGCAPSQRLTASMGHAIGIGMTPSVIRDGVHKSHIVLGAPYISPIADAEDPNFQHALHLLAHECAHVEINHKFDLAFPGVGLRTAYEDVWKACRGQVIFACWDEYAATSRSARYGEDPTEGYEDTFIKVLAVTRTKANDFIKAYRIHGDVDRVLHEVYGAYGELLKFTAYHVGNLDGHGVSPSDRPKTVEALAGNWFAPHFEQLHAACRAVADDYGRWPDRGAFNVIGDMADKVVAGGGLTLRYSALGHVHVDIPFTAETMPAE